MKKILKSIVAVAVFSAFCAIPSVSQAAVSLSAISSEVSHHPANAAKIAGNAAQQSPGQAAQIAVAAMNGLGRHATPHRVAAIIKAVLPYLTNVSEPCKLVSPVVLAGFQILSENGMLNARAVKEVLDAVNPLLPPACVGNLAQAVGAAYPQFADVANSAAGNGSGTASDAGNVNTSGPILPATFLTGGGGGGGGGLVPPVTPVK